MGLSWSCAEIWMGSRKVTLQNRALGAAAIYSSGSSQVSVWTKPALGVVSSAAAELVQGRGVSVMNCGVKPLPGGLGGSNSLLLVAMVLDCSVKMLPASLAAPGDPPGLVHPALHSLICHLRGVWDSLLLTLQSVHELIM